MAMRTITLLTRQAVFSFRPAEPHQFPIFSLVPASPA